MNNKKITEAGVRIVVSYTYNYIYDISIIICIVKIIYVM